MKYYFDNENVDIVSLSKDLEVFFPGKSFTILKEDQVIIDFTVTLTTQEQSSLSTAVANHKNGYADFILERNKKAKIIEIDEKTKELISSGFSYDGSQFSLSHEAQINAAGLKIAADNGLVSYPVGMTTIDDNEYSITDVTSLTNYYLSGLGTKKAYLDSGRALKLQCNAASTQEELDAVIDNR